MSLLRDIDNILQYGAKTTSYKHATLLAIFDHVAEFPGARPVNNFHFIPAIHFAKQFLAYYYPFSFSSIAQGTLAQGKTPRIITYINDFKEMLERESNQPPQPSQPGLPEHLQKAIIAKEQGFKWLALVFDENAPLPTSLVSLLVKIRKEILDQPLRLVHKVEGEVIRFFSIVNGTLPFNSEYDRHVDAGKQCSFPGLNSPAAWQDLLEADDTSIIIDDFTYKELARFRFWGRNVVIKAWLDYLGAIPGNASQPVTDIMHYFTCIYDRGFDRDPALTARYRDLYARIHATTPGDPIACLYTGTPLANKPFHLDHFLPWAYYPVNRFWNLVPADPKVNLDKSARIPAWTPAIETRFRAHLHACIQHAMGDPTIANDLAYFYKIVYKNPAYDFLHGDPAEIEETLLVHVKNERAMLEEIVPGKKFVIVLP